MSLIRADNVARGFRQSGGNWALYARSESGVTLHEHSNKNQTVDDFVLKRPPTSTNRISVGNFAAVEASEINKQSFSSKLEMTGFSY
jgi:hypothetical protein